MDNDAIRDEASRILLDKDFQQYQPKQPDMLEPFWRWLRDLLDFDIPSGAGNSPIWGIFGLIIKVVLILLLTFAVGFGIYKLIMHFSGPQDPVEMIGISKKERLESRENYVRMAEAALRDGDYRLAIHYLLMAAVTMVIRDTSFHHAEFLTNRELASSSDFSAYANAGQLNRMLHDMVHFDEPCWFGKNIPTDTDFQEFRKVYSQFQSTLEVGNRRG